MLIDARTVPGGTVIETEVCIIGGGAAGITLAREFAASNFRVALLESGGLEHTDANQQLFAGRNIGLPYYDASSVRLRLRYFGGATNHWAGWCALPDALDFEPREGVPHTGWPFSRAQLEPFYRRAQEVCGLGPFGFTTGDWGIAAADIPPPFNGPHFVCQTLQLSPPTRFAEVYGPALRAAPKLTVYLNANALRFEDSGGSVRALSVGVQPDLRRLTVRARTYVLAAGGIENARLLLLSGREGGNGLGNANDLVGRFFMVHTEYPGGSIALANAFMDFKFHTIEGARAFIREGVERAFVAYVCLSEETRRAQRLPQLRMRFRRVGPQQRGELHDSVRAAMLGLGGDAVVQRAQFPPPPMPVTALAILCTSEQFPNPDSRIALGSDTDAFGLRTVTVNWQLTAADRRGMGAAHRLLGQELGRTGFGRLLSAVPDNESSWPREAYGDEHNIGTTRMHRDPKLGVVDGNGRVHGIGNLYVAGSSVFPTEGAANPTLTIVALALRLADHIKGQFR
jgi:choline dehydrogenase-like flavoprotein